MWSLLAHARRRERGLMLLLVIAVEAFWIAGLVVAAIWLFWRI